MPTLPTIRRPLVLAAVMAATFMIAVEATIVSTAMPKIAGQLGDLHLYSWVFSAYLLAQTATTVVFGKLADLYGRRPVLLGGIAIFLLGSALCGFAWSLPSLVLFRLIQGIGAGAIQPISLTIVGDLYPVRERGKVQGYLASVWGISSVLGPLAGGLISQHLSWSWVFWVNLPLGLAAMGLFARFLHESVEPQARQVDAAGAALFAAAITALMVALTLAGTAGGGTVAAWALAAVAVGAVFIWQQRHARDPMIAVGLWARRPIATANAVTLLSGMTIIGLTTFLPMYVQAVLDRSALVAGFAMTAMVLGWPAGSTLAVRIFPRFGLRATLLLGAALLPLGAVAFVVLAPGMSPVLAGTGSFVTGLGMGLLSTAAILIIQDTVGWAERGVATASNIFSRNLGSTLGATAFGAVLNASLARHLDGLAPVNLDQLRQVLDQPGVVADAAVRAALAHGLHLTFWAMFVVAALALALALLVPKVVLSPAPREVPGD